MKVFICENSIDGIFSGIYRAYASKYGHTNTALITSDALSTYELFCDYEDVPVNEENSRKVADTLCARLGQETYRDICQAINAAETPGEQCQHIHKAEAVYKTVVLALSMKDGTRILDNLGNPYINRVFQLSRCAGNESHHLMGFLRFSELENGILFARIHPRNNILTVLADHFTDRLPMENFIIYDETRKTAALHRSGSGYMLTDVPEADEDFMNRFSGQELEYQKLWLTFFQSIAIDARKNPKLQNQNIPRRFQQDVIEFKSSPGNIS